jgi:hypothetical protein
VHAAAADYTLASQPDNSRYLDSWREQFSENGVVKVRMDTTTQQGHYFINMLPSCSFQNGSII